VGSNLTPQYQYQLRGSGIDLTASTGTPDHVNGGSKQDFSPMSEGATTSGESDGKELYAHHKTPSPDLLCGVTGSGIPAPCGNSDIEINDHDQNPLSYDLNRSCPYQPNAGKDKEESIYTQGGIAAHKAVFDPYATRTFENYSLPSYTECQSSKSFSTVAALSVSNPEPNVVAHTSYHTRPQASYSDSVDSAIYPRNALPTTPHLGSFKNGAFSLHSHNSPIYSANQQGHFNPFGSSAAYGTQYSCDYTGSPVTGVSSSPYAYMGSSDLYSGGPPSFSYDPGNVAAAMNYRMPMNHPSTTYMNGINASYGEFPSCSR